LNYFDPHNVNKMLDKLSPIQKRIFLIFIALMLTGALSFGIVKIVQAKSKKSKVSPTPSKLPAAPAEKPTTV
jgi:uncharacterized membrane protein YwzB